MAVLPITIYKRMLEMYREQNNLSVPIEDVKINFYIAGYGGDKALKWIKQWNKLRMVDVDDDFIVTFPEEGMFIKTRRPDYVSPLF